MTLYVGEQIRISTVAREYAVRGRSGAPITPDNVTSVKITILNQDKTVLINDATMTWSADEMVWYYKWNTDTGVTAGTFHYKITVVGSDGRPSIEWGKVRLARQPTIAT